MSIPNSPRSPISPTKVAFDLISKLANDVGRTLHLRDDHLGYLPMEDWDKSVEFLDFETLKAFVLVNGYFYTVGRARLYSNVKLMVEKECLIHFHSIAADLDWARCVKSIQFYDAEWSPPRCPLYADESGPESQNEHLDPNQQEYVKFYKEWKSLIDSSEDIIAYQLITLQKFPRLERLEIKSLRNNFVNLDHPELRSEYKYADRLHHRILQEPVHQRGGSSGRAESVLLVSAANAGRGIRYLAIDSQPLLGIMLFPNEVKSAMRASIKNLQELRLRLTGRSLTKPWSWEFDQGQGHDMSYRSSGEFSPVTECSAEKVPKKRVHREVYRVLSKSLERGDIANWLRCAENLRILHLNLGIAGYSVMAAASCLRAYLDISRPWKKLETFIFEEVRCESKELLKFIRAHGKTLKNLALRNITLIGGDWGKFLTKLRNMIDEGKLCLSSFDLNGALEWQDNPDWEDGGYTPQVSWWEAF